MPILDLLNSPASDDVSPTEHITTYDAELLRRAGAHTVAEQWRRVGPDGIDTTDWGYPSAWLDTDRRIRLPNRTL